MLGKRRHKSYLKYVPNKEAFMRVIACWILERYVEAAADFPRSHKSCGERTVSTVKTVIKGPSSRILEQREDGAHTPTVNGRFADRK
jgi:hypothetical protein